MGLGTNLFGKYETEPGGGWGPVADGAKYGRNLKRQNWDDRGQRFLKGFIGEKSKNRGSATAAAANQTGDSAKKVASQFGQLGDDITIEKGYRDKGFTVEGTPGKKGILGHVARGAGAAFGGPFGAMAGNVAGSYLDYM